MASMSAIGSDSMVAGNSVAAGPKDAKSALGRDAFMLLLVTQLKNQDPLKPLEDKDFISQLAQFSSLEETKKISTSIEGLTSAQTSATKTGSVGFIGKQVISIGDSVKLVGGSAGPLQYNLEKGASSVDVSITDASGKVVRTLHYTNVQSGMNSAQWDGRDNDGNKLSDGDYKFDVKASAVDGSLVQASTTMTGIVTSVKYKLGQPYLIIGSAEVPLSNVMEVK